MRVVAVAHLIDNLPRALAEGAEGAESERAVVQVPVQVLLVHDLVVVANLLLVVAVSTVATLHLRLDSFDVSVEEGVGDADVDDCRKPVVGHVGSP